jgi:hypothetical protein
MIAALTWSPTAITLALAGGYVGCGLWCAGMLVRRGASSETALSALVVWPLLLPMLSSASPPATGPLSGRIEQAFLALRSVIGEVGNSSVEPSDLDGLQAALHRADERVALVDRWIARELSARDGAGVEALQAARDRAVSEIEAVLAGLAQLRLQIGLLTLAGPQDASVRDQLQGLQARVAALEEVGRLQGPSEA